MACVGLCMLLRGLLLLLDCCVSVAAGVDLVTDSSGIANSSLVVAAADGT